MRPFLFFRFFRGALCFNLDFRRSVSLFKLAVCKLAFLLANIIEIAVHHPVDVSIERNFAILEPDRPRTEAANGIHIVGDEEDSCAALHQLFHLFHALDLKAHVADRQRLIDDEDLGADKDICRKGKAGKHAA